MQSISHELSDRTCIVFIKFCRNVMDSTDKTFGQTLSLNHAEEAKYYSSRSAANCLFI